MIWHIVNTWVDEWVGVVDAGREVRDGGKRVCGRECSVWIVVIVSVGGGGRRKGGGSQGRGETGREGVGGGERESGRGQREWRGGREGREKGGEGRGGQRGEMAAVKMWATEMGRDSGGAGRWARARGKGTQERGKRGARGGATGGRWWWCVRAGTGGGVWGWPRERGTPASPTTPSHCTHTHSPHTHTHATLPAPPPRPRWDSPSPPSARPEPSAAAHTTHNRTPRRPFYTRAPLGGGSTAPRVLRAPWASSLTTTCVAWSAARQTGNAVAPWCRCCWR